MEKAFLKYQKEKEQKNLMTYPSKFTDFFFFFFRKRVFYWNKLQAVCAERSKCI